MKVVHDRHTAEASSGGSSSSSRRKAKIAFGFETTVTTEFAAAAEERPLSHLV